MNYAQLLKEIGVGPHGARDLDVGAAHELFAAMLDGGVPDLELGAILLALRMKGESVDEMLGFYDALATRLDRVRIPELAVKPVVIPSYGGAQLQANLLPLLALLLKRYGIPVLIHGALESHGRVSTAHVLRELGIMPCGSAQQVTDRLAADGVVFVPVAALAPGLASLLALRAQLGVRNSAHRMAKFLDPVDGGSVMLVPYSNPEFADKARGLLTAIGVDALVMAGTEGEAFANPQRRSKIERMHDGTCTLLFDAEAPNAQAAGGPADSIEARVTADWIRQAIAGAIAVPHPILNQVACCLYACGYTDSLNQAKAIVAIESGNLAAA